jgi:hypothetical protein
MKVRQAQKEDNTLEDTQDQTSIENLITELQQIKQKLNDL